MQNVANSQLCIGLAGWSEKMPKRSPEFSIHPDIAFDTHARLELGVDPDAGGSAWQASMSSFLAFAIGAFLPLIPWLFTGGAQAVVLSICIAALAAGALGAAIGAFTGRGISLGPQSVSSLPQWWRRASPSESVTCSALRRSRRPALQARRLLALRFGQERRNAGVQRSRDGSSQLTQQAIPLHPRDPECLCVSTFTHALPRCRAR